MSALVTTLHYYPDAADDASVEFGTVTFFVDEEAGSRMAWFQPNAEGVFISQRATHEAWMRRILQNFSGFLDGVIDELPVYADVEGFTRGLLTSLPVNFRHGEVDDYPDKRIVLRLAESLGLSVHQEAKSAERHPVPA
jgi:hypothetical protein